MIPIGRVHEIVRYPVKSMAGIPMESAELGLHGIEGDRRFAFRRVGDRSAFPFLSASRLPALLTYQPVGETQVRTPSGNLLELRGEELQNEIASRFGSPVELMMFKNGIFDDGVLSIISLSTTAAIHGDRRRFRANVYLETDRNDPFHEDEWVGSTLVFGDAEDAAMVAVNAVDERCVMVNFDPDTAAADSNVMKAIVRMNGNNAGVYAAVVRAGTISAGQTVFRSTSTSP